jgi:hypothetical protein
MRYQEIRPNMEKLLSYDSIVHTLLERVPEFRTVRVQQDDSLPHVVFGDFAIFLRDRISAGMTSDSVTAEAFKLLNEMATSSDSEVANLLIVSVFEILADRAACIETARRFLVGKARDLFEEVVAIDG